MLNHFFNFTTCLWTNTSKKNKIWNIFYKKRNFLNFNLWKMLETSLCRCRCKNYFYLMNEVFLWKRVFYGRGYHIRLKLVMVILIVVKGSFYRHCDFLLFQDLDATNLSSFIKSKSVNWYLSLSITATPSRTISLSY